MTKFWFLIWLSGAMVSLATIVKYVEVKRMWNYVKEAVGLEDKISVKIQASEQLFYIHSMPRRERGQSN